jgi:diadenosine tetraphosphatase ApaH/serine/threonine PP2A family protein phosphatase
MPDLKDPAFFALISDIHGNIDALDAVLADIGQHPCRGILCLGDIVGYGPEPAACVQRVMDRCAISVLGNHEAMLFLTDQYSSDEFGEIVGVPLALAARQLGSHQQEWLRALPITADISPLSLSHASLHEPRSFHYIHSDEEVRRHFAAQTTFINFHGHTHVPVIWEKRNEDIACFHPMKNFVQLDPSAQYTVNVGSVGQPRDDDPRACYALYDFENRLLVHRRVEYDIPRARLRFKKADLPARNSSRLKKGQ